MEKQPKLKSKKGPRLRNTKQLAIAPQDPPLPLPDPKIYSNIGSYFKAVREDYFSKYGNRYSQSNVSTRLFLQARNYISAIERCTTTPSTQFAVQLGELLNIPRETILYFFVKAATENLSIEILGRDYLPKTKAN